ncbi:MAG TPA: glycine cleavage T C-terminal barrel domain-containing protein [Anaerolineales bacterium]|nr:glycine cleavage T C-terminal barrel domain-containing protein [Anaerolineales bacterium]
MRAQNSISLVGYEAALSGSAFYPQAEAGYLRIGGPDRQSFLQRQSTNDVGLLSAERSVTTVLTSATARILDVLTLIAEPEAIGAITLPGLAAATTRFLQSRIFFMDQVTVEDASGEFAQIDLMGPKAAQTLLQLGLERVPSEDEMAVGDISRTGVLILSQQKLGYRLLVAAEQAERISAIMLEGGAAQLAPEHYAVIRVEVGLPAAGHELTEDYTPLETGLAWAISNDKGCYTGQEVIARQITYDKITRQLVGLKLGEEAKSGDKVWTLEGNKSVGNITSIASSPCFGHIALAVIKKPYYEPETKVLIGDLGAAIQGTVTTLPFRGEA